jgi:hypothetical protein
MYCRRCYAMLDASEFACRRCGRRFDPLDEGSYLERPFPGIGKITGYLFLTTAVSLVVAFVVSCFQLAAAGGH